MKNSNKGITNIGDHEFRTRMMAKVVAHVKKHGELHVPLLALVSCFIDGLAKGSKSKTKKAYINYLRKHFPELCKELGAEIFYTKFRCATIHEFSIKEGFGIARDSELKGKYTEYYHNILWLNIDKLVDEFLAHIEKIRPKKKTT